MLSTLPSQLYSSAQVRRLDNTAISEAGIPGIVLMKRAGRAGLELLSREWPQCKALIVVCGGGNNGGDGYVVAGLAAMQGLEVSLYSVVDPARLKGDAKRAHDFAIQEGLEVRSADSLSFDGAEGAVIVDAVLGIGFEGELRSEVRQALQALAESELPVLALDVPSGLNADTGAADIATLKATHTLSFIGLKVGLCTGEGPQFCGQLHFSDLDVPESVYNSESAWMVRIDRENRLPARAKNAHKGQFGHVLIVGGDSGMGGAAMLAAEAALRSGAGLVTLATKSEHVSSALSRLPEVMTVGVEAGPQLEPLLARADVIVLGPGLGQSAWSQQLKYFALTAKKPTVVDADALNMLAADHEVDENFASSKWLLTPHPGEASRLLGCTVKEVEANRPLAVQSLSSKYACSVLLKGAGSLIHEADRTSLATVGNPGMAVAGMGDVLSGVIGALLAQNLSPRGALETAVCAHGYAGDRAAEIGETGIRASDLMPFLREYLNWQPGKA